MQGYGVLEFFDYIRENRATINSEDDLWKNARELDSEGQRDLLEFMRLICEGVFYSANGMFGFLRVLFSWFSSLALSIKVVPKGFATADCQSGEGRDCTCKCRSCHENPIGTLVRGESEYAMHMCSAWPMVQCS